VDQTSQQRPFRLVEVESWPECREVIVEGRLEREALGEFDDCLLRALEAPHDYLLIDLDRCEGIDVEAVKQLVIARQRFSDQQRELVVFGAEGPVREMLEKVGAFEILRSGREATEARASDRLLCPSGPAGPHGT
jgi:anti-anti-sigma regulatory factor